VRSKRGLIICGRSEPLSFPQQVSQQAEGRDVNNIESMRAEFSLVFKCALKALLNWRGTLARFTTIVISLTTEMAVSATPDLATPVTTKTAVSATTKFAVSVTTKFLDQPPPKLPSRSPPNLPSRPPGHGN